MSRPKRFDRVFEKVGRIRNSSGVVVTSRADLKRFQARDQILTKLYENGQLQVLRAFKDGQVSIEQLVEAARDEKLQRAHLLADLKLSEFLWHQDALCPKVEKPDAEHSEQCLGAVDKALLRMGKSSETRRRYKTSGTKLANSGYMDADARVSDLALLDFSGLREDWWEGSAADWNHLGRFLSHFLTVHLGKSHPVRYEVLERFKREDEGEGRVPDLSVDQFWELVGRTPQHAQPCYVFLAATGMRFSEYIKVRKSDINFDSCAIKIPGGKTGRRPIKFDSDLRDWIDRAVPAPLQYKWMREYFVRARGEMGLDDLWMRDLRHCMAQWATDEGMGEAMVGDALGHKSGKMTRRYTRQKNRGQVASAVARAMGKTKVIPFRRVG